MYTRRGRQLSYHLPLLAYMCTVVSTHTDWTQIQALTWVPLQQPSGSSAEWSTPSHSTTGHYHVYQPAPARQNFSPLISSVNKTVERGTDPSLYEELLQCPWYVYTLLLWRIISSYAG